MKDPMTNLTPYIKQFASLNRAPGATWSDATKRKAPHKPLLLLAVLDLVHRGVITAPFIAVSGDLVELNELFNLYWRRIIPLVVCHCYRENDSIIRIIPARKATRPEKNSYGRFLK